MGNPDRNRDRNREELAALVAEARLRRTSTPAPQAEDVVFDFEGAQVPDLMGLTMVLTARMVAEEQDVGVWLKDLPERSWALLRALDVDHLFDRFPEPADVPD